MSFWMADNTNVYQGQCHIFKYPNPIKAESALTGIKVLLNPTARSYLILLHDPNFFLVIGTPGVFFPRVLKRYYKVTFKNFELFFIAF